ncbi:C40 family peptidase [Nocardia uniformis]|uniref:C40 family peptidase n=2 Tax=Nocardia uniformis TaxID=53432 RepID=A0A849C5C4_9NOCA|nr:C40 family peptidase [Nocardia uniformis]
MVVPGLGTTAAPNLVGVPTESGRAEIPNLAEVPSEFGRAENPDTAWVQGHSRSAVPAFEAAPAVLAISEPAVPASTTPTLPTAVADLLPTSPAAAPPPGAPQGHARSVDIAGLGTFAVPDGMPPLAGIPGVVEIPAPTVLPKQRSTGERAVEAARSKLGTSYSMGGNGPDSFDCSGLVRWSYAEAGVDLPRTSYGQLAAGTPVGIDELQPGDLVSYNGGGHSALYAGDGRIIHASTYGVGVTESALDEMSITGARRY